MIMQPSARANDKLSDLYWLGLFPLPPDGNQFIRIARELRSTITAFRKSRSNSHPISWETTLTRVNESQFRGQRPFYNCDSWFKYTCALP